VEYENGKTLHCKGLSEQQMKWICKAFGRKLLQPHAGNSKAGNVKNVNVNENLRHFAMVNMIDVKFLR